MLRAAVLLLVLANGVYYAWSQGLLLSFGWAPAQQEEPYRVAQQIRPEAVRVLPASESRPADPAAKAPECLQAGPFDDKLAEPVRQLLAGGHRAAGRWSRSPSRAAGSSTWASTPTPST
jgi:hypothetical protein